MTAVKDQLIGHVLDDRYLVIEQIARGGMAMVYRGVDMRLDRSVAIKVMHPHLTSDEGFVMRFRSEALHAAKLSHPNLVAVHDQGRDEDAVYLVMEYVRSETLRDRLRREGRLTPREAIIIIDAILSALQTVHRSGIIHRDLKPDNILLGDNGQIKLADFGLARAVSSSTTTKTLIGTVGYVAPELVTRSETDARTDLYTVGIVFYEMLTGHPPYTDDMPIQVAYRHVHDSVPKPSEELPELPAGLDELVVWATQRKRQDRPADAEELRMRLHQVRSELSDAELDMRPLDRDDLRGLGPVHSEDLEEFVSAAAGEQHDAPAREAGAAGDSAAATHAGSERAEEAPSAPRRRGFLRRKRPADAPTTRIGQASAATGAAAAAVSTAATTGAADEAADVGGPGTGAGSADAERTGAGRTGGPAGPADTDARGSAETPDPAGGEEPRTHTSDGTGDASPPAKDHTTESRAEDADRARTADTDDTAAGAARTKASAGGAAGKASAAGGGRTSPAATGKGAGGKNSPRAGAGKAEAGAGAATPAARSESEGSPRRTGGLLASVKGRRAAGLGVLALLVVAVVIAVWAFAAGPLAMRTVPDNLAGTEGAAAAEQLESMGFEVSTSTAHHDEVPEGLVLDTIPAGGTELRRGDAVTLITSLGPELFQVPEVTGMSVDEARTALEEAGLSLGEVNEEYSDSVAQDVLIRQSEEPGTELRAGAGVDVVVSQGVEPISVPYVRGLSYEAAASQLSRLGFLVAREDVFDQDVPAGRVVSQTPGEGAERHEGDLIMLKVSKGPMAQPEDDGGDDEGED